MRPLSILLTNNALNQRAGTETYIRDVALALTRRGHHPVAFSVVLGEIAAEMQAGTVPVIDDLAQLGEPPDVIHGHHHVETLIAALTFPGVPIVNFCHGWIPWEEMPLQHPSVRRYVAVDEVCVDRLVRVEGIDPSCVDLLLNFVDLDRFRPRPALPARPTRAVVVSNGATPDNYTRSIAAACAAAGITLDIVGRAVGSASPAPETVLPAYDLVFAKARTALEALAVGCATIITDVVGAGPLVTPENYAALRVRNFGVRELRRAHETTWYTEQIAHYDAAAATVVSERVRTEASMEPAIDRLLEIYAAAMAAPPGRCDPLRAAAAHLTRIAGPMKEAPVLRLRVDQATQNLAAAQAEAESLRTRVTALTSELEAARTEIRGLQNRDGLLTERVAAQEARVNELRVEVASRDGQVSTALRELAQARTALSGASAVAEARGQEIASLKSLTALKLRDALLQIPVLGRLMRSGARGLLKLVQR